MAAVSIRVILNANWSNCSNQIHTEFTLCPGWCYFKEDNDKQLKIVFLSAKLSFLCGRTPLLCFFLLACLYWCKTECRSKVSWMYDLERSCCAHFVSSLPTLTINRNGDTPFFTLIYTFLRRSPNSSSQELLQATTQHWGYTQSRPPPQECGFSSPF